MTRRGGARNDGVTWTRRVEVDRDAVIDALTTLGVGKLKNQVMREYVDKNGNPMRPYSLDYGRQLADSGRDTRVNLVLSGSLMASIGRRASDRGGQDGIISVFIGPDQGRSPEYRFDPEAGKLRPTGASGPKHDLLALYLIWQGRDWLGWTRESLRKIRVGLSRMRILRSRRR